MVVTKQMVCGNTALLKRTVGAKTGQSVKILTPCNLPFEQLPPSYCRKTAVPTLPPRGSDRCVRIPRIFYVSPGRQTSSSLFDHFHSVGSGLDVDLSEMSVLLLKKDNQ